MGNAKKVDRRVRVRVGASKFSDRERARIYNAIQLAVNEGRSFRLSLNPDGEAYFELGPRMPEIERLIEIGMRVANRSKVRSKVRVRKARRAKGAA